MKKQIFYSLILCLLAYFPSFARESANLASSPETPPTNYTFKIINTYPHDKEAFTQGLVFKNGLLYEGTGLYGKSTLRKTELESGAIEKNILLEPKFFGEGIAVLDNKIYQLTLNSHLLFIYNLGDLKLIKTAAYEKDGWGLTTDGKHLIASDGTDNLYFLDKDTLREVKRISVKSCGAPVDKLNELEFIKGKIYANIFGENRIALIDPKNGEVNSWINLGGLLNTQGDTQAEDVLNGIAYDELNDRLFVTGKRWPQLFEIKIIPAEENRGSLSSSPQDPRDSAKGI